MLVLSRKCGEGIVLPGLDVRITVLGVRGKRVRIGVTAPPELVVHREELLHRAFTSGMGVSKLVVSGEFAL